MGPRVIRQYIFDRMTLDEAKALDGKVVTIDTWADGELGLAEERHERVRVMRMGWTLLLLADDSPGPPAEVLIELVRTVEVHEATKGDFDRTSRRSES